MFEVGFSELLLIMALALIVLGPEKLPKVASQVGRWMGRARAMARQFRETLEDEVQLEPTIRRPGGHAAGTGSSAGSAASASGVDPVATAAAAAGGLAAAATDSDPANAATPGSTYSDGLYSAPADDADTRHNDYTGADYLPPDSSLDPLAPTHPPVASQESAGGESPAEDTRTGFDPNLDPTAAADVHGQRGA